jgi:hypothetical protein
MTEESLNELSFDALLDLMVTSVNELLELNKTHGHATKLGEKNYEIRLIQKVILAKRSAEAVKNNSKHVY